MTCNTRSTWQGVAETVHCTRRGKMLICGIVGGCVARGRARNLCLLCFRKKRLGKILKDWPIPFDENLLSILNFSDNFSNQFSDDLEI